MLLTNPIEHIDPKLVNRLKAGDMQAFQQVFNAYSERLYHFANSYLKDNFESEEIVQDVFLRIWELREDIDEEKSLKSFLYRITVNKVLNHLKHQVVRQKYENYLLHFDQSLSESPEAIIHFKELGEKINVLMDKLPDQQKNIFSLSRFEGVPNSEIASQLGLSVRTVENQIYRASKFLKDHLRDEYIFLLLSFWGIL